MQIKYRRATIEDLQSLHSMEILVFPKEQYHTTPRRQYRYILTKAANLVGKGFYGVDLKQRKDNGQAIIIEVNDNPSLETGVEDMLLGDELYRMILQHLVRRIEAKA